MLEYSITATLCLAPSCPKPLLLAGRSGWSPIALSPSQSRAGQWDRVTASYLGLSFPWDHFPEGIRDVGRSRACLALPWGCRGLAAPRCSPPAVGSGRAAKQRTLQGAGAASWEAGRGMGALQIEPQEGEGLTLPPTQKSHSCPLDYRGTEAGEQSIPAYLGH